MGPRSTHFTSLACWTGSNSSCCEQQTSLAARRPSNATAARVLRLDLPQRFGRTGLRPPVTPRNASGPRYPPLPLLVSRCRSVLLYKEPAFVLLM